MKLVQFLMAWGYAVEGTILIALGLFLMSNMRRVLHIVIGTGLTQQLVDALSVFVHMLVSVFLIICGFWALFLMFYNISDEIDVKRGRCYVPS